MMFTNQIKTKWLLDGREMILLEDVSFIDKNLKKWTAKQGVVIDGASIPRFFWRFIGSPFTGLYRRPSVLHDYYYGIKSESKADIDKMFYEAMLYSGVSKFKAWMMYQAVKRFGTEAFNKK